MATVLRTTTLSSATRIFGICGPTGLVAGSGVSDSSAPGAMGVQEPVVLKFTQKVLNPGHGNRKHGLTRHHYVSFRRKIPGASRSEIGVYEARLSCAPG